ncbi:MAG TPA: hypothetical protein VJU61_01310 [Polyangiaceae bacterium]|nr:hypothetical protein [Polyangiaceae bacterium]
MRVAYHWSMLLHVMVVPARSRWVLGALVLAGSLLAAQREARACGATPTEVQALLPVDGATNVPLNAVLISSSNTTDAVFELHEMLDGSSDAGASDAPAVDGGATPPSDAGASGALALRVDCGAQGQGGGAVCLARPLAALKPSTRYTWRTNVVVPEGYLPEYFQGLSREFTTGTASDDEPIAIDAVSLVLVEDYPAPSSVGGDCGPSHRMDVAYTLRASEPAVLHFVNYTPSYVMHATLLSGDPDATETAATLYSPPDCLAPSVYDAAGHHTVLPEWCPGEGAAPTTQVEDSSGDAIGPPRGGKPVPNVPTVVTSRDRSRCALSMPGTSTSPMLPAAGLGLVLFLAARRSRRT